MTYHYFIGFDCSKKTLDYALVNGASQLLDQGQIENTTAAITKLVDNVLADVECPLDQVLLCAENTGLYSNRLKLAATQQNYSLWCEDALEIKLRSGRQKSKTDAIDAHLIACYSARYAGEAVVFTMPQEISLKVKQISRQRTRLLQDIIAWKTRLAEELEFSLIKTDQEVMGLLKNHLKQGEKTLAKLDKKLTELVCSEPSTKRLYDITLSVPGFGLKNTITILAETEMYTKISNGKACSSYAGLSPHEHQSGTSIKRKARTSKACNKRLKTAVHLGAMSLIRRDNIYRRLYDRLRNKGKHHLQAVNAVRNKMVTVLFACIEKDNMYQKNLHGSLQVP